MVPIGVGSVTSCTRFRDELHEANWFGEEGRRYHIKNNFQADELVSDGASIGHTPSDFYRVLGYEGAARDQTANYHATTSYARDLMRQVNARRADPQRLSETRLAELFASGDSDALSRGLGMTPTELEWVRQQYVEGARAVVGMYVRALPRELPRILGR